MKRKAVLLGKDLAVKDWAGLGAMLYHPVDGDPGEMEQCKAIVPLTNSELVNLIAWHRQRSGVEHAPDDLAEQIVAGVVNREISVRSAAEAIRWMEARAADEALRGWVGVPEDEAVDALTFIECAQAAPAEDAIRLDFDEWAEIHGSGRSQNDV